MIYREFARIAAENKNREALYVDGEVLTYAELQSSIESAALAYQQRGIGRDDVILLIVGNGKEFVASVFAGLAIGAVVVPINTRFPVDEIAYYLQSSAASIIVHEGDGAVYKDAGFEVPLQPVDALLSVTSPTGFQSADIIESQPALYMYSSGSTGRPKRVTRSHGQVMREYYALAATLGLSSADRILCTVPLYHAHGFGNCMMAALMSAGCLLIHTGEFNARETMRTIQLQRVSIYPAVPFMYKMIADSFFKEKPELADVRLMFSAGAPLTAEVEQKFYEKFGVRIRQLYGSTETGAVAINFSKTEGTPDSVGKPLQGVVIAIFDENGQPLPEGEIGEVAIKSPAMTRQYDGLPEVTEECFIGEFFYPGDLGCLDKHGNLYIKGRKKLMINVAGYKVDPVDVEDVIRTHPGVQEVVVLAKVHDIYGEMVKAVVVRDDSYSPALDQADVVELCKQQLADYKIPKVVEFRDEIPRSPLGKILRKYL